MPAILVPQEADDEKHHRRIDTCPEEWIDDFGAEFYEHVLDNGFYYLAPGSEWKTSAESVPAPGMTQYEIPDAAELQVSMENLMRGTKQQDG